MVPGHGCSHWDLQYPLLVLLPTRVAGSAPPAAGRRGAFLPGFFDSGLFLGRKHDAFTCRCIASTAIGACQQGTKPAERGGRCCWFMQFGDSPKQFFHHLLWHRTIQKRFLAGCYNTGKIIGIMGAGDAFFAGPLGVRIVDRFRHRVQDASRVSLKWSRGVLLTMRFSAVHTGQVNRIT